MEDPDSSFLLLQVLQEPITSFILFNVIVLVLLLALSALISGSEVAFFALSQEEIKYCQVNPTNGKGRIPQLLSRPKLLLATILILNNLVNVAIVTISTFFTWRLYGIETANGSVVAILTAVITFAIVFFGEVTPKIYANQNKMKFAVATAPFLNIANFIFRPLSWFLMSMGDMIEKRVETKGYDISVDELTHALELTDAGNSTKEEKEILKGIVNFGSLTVKQIMTSRMDITAFDYDLDFHELMDKINKTGFSRVPVYKETIDKIEGILYIKDFLPYIDKDEHFQWQQMLRPSFFVPENKRVEILLGDFQQKRVHMALVVDEYGGIQGLITLEDIIEEIVGEINDEFDDEQIVHQKLDVNTFIFEGKVSLNDFCKVIDKDPEIFEEVKGDSESLGGLLLELLAKIPRAGEKIQYGKFIFTVIAVDNKRIKRVRVFINADNSKSSSDFTD